jgi:hypothetical protein
MAFLLVVLAFLVAPSLMPFARAQMGGRLVVDTDYEVYGLGNLDGGGHLTWTLSDDQASHLRWKIVNFFENYTQMPPGFNCEGTAIANTPDSEIGADEGLDYTNMLEHYLENSCGRGWGLTDRYLRISAADKVEAQFPVERSTEGLVGSTAADTTKLQIRFIFNANTTDGSMRFPLAEPNIADAVHKVFNLDYNSFFFKDSLGIDYLRPFNSVQGWHTTFVGTQKVLTMSYVASPPTANNSFTHWGFANSAVNSSDARPAFTPEGNSANPGLNFSKDYFDLRYAEPDPAATYAEFEYVGYTAENGDRLHLQVATNAPQFDNWVNVNNEAGFPYFNNSTWPTDWTQPWPTVRFPLDMYAGQAVRFRLNFTSDANNFTAPGFFIRNFRLRGDSSYHGLVEFNTVTYSVSSSSFSGFDISRGSANMIRTPAGDILLFSISYDKEGYGANATTPSDSIYFSTFDFFENAQITFALVVVAAYLIAYYQHRYFLQFKGAHPIRYRPAAAKIGWLHWVGRICIILLILFYFFPGIFTFAAPSLLISGAVMWVLGITFTLSCALVSKFIYLRQTKYIPPEYEEGGAAAETPPPGEPVPTQFCADCLEVIESPANAYKCECGKVYHKLCASGMSECPECHRKITVQLPKEKVITVQCPTCREVQQVKEGADLARTKCTHCDTVLRALDDGLNYLVIDNDPGTSYSWLLGMARREKPTLCMTTSFPEKVVKEYRLEGVEMYWLSDTNPGPKTLDPKRLEFEVIRALSNFAKDFKGGAIILDGLEYLVVENGFDKTFKFIKKVNDLCSVHGTTFIVPITPGALGPDELTMLRKEFDRVEELAAPPPPPPPKKRSAPRTG